MSDLEVCRYKRFLLVTKQTKGNSMISAEMELWATKMPYCTYMAAIGIFLSPPTTYDDN
jgi:hypothetical protein